MCPIYAGALPIVPWLLAEVQNFYTLTISTVFCTGTEESLLDCDVFVPVGTVFSDSVYYPTGIRCDGKY